MTRYVLALQEIGEDSVQRCGGKAVGLGRLLRQGLTVPPGFCIVDQALAHVVEANSIGPRIAEIAGGLDFEDYDAVDRETAEIRSLLASAAIPDDLEREILDSYRRLVTADNEFVAVRSSVAVRDSAISSFPGMMDTYHYVLGEAAVVEKVRQCWASLWSVRAAFARHRKGVPHDKGIIAPVVQLMVDSEMAGVLFTANPVSSDTGEIVIESNWGLGESVVSGKSINDFFALDKATLAVKQRVVGKKTVMVTRDDERGSGRTERPVPPDRSEAATLSDARLTELAQVGRRIEEHFGFPVDVEWAFHGDTLYILQARKIGGLSE